nr:MAG TPA: hypothetical protein [Caudoviricetes sp.]
MLRKSIPNFYISKQIRHKSIPNSVSPTVSPIGYLTFQHYIISFYNYHRSPIFQ